MKRRKIKLEIQGTKGLYRNGTYIRKALKIVKYNNGIVPEYICDNSTLNTTVEISDSIVSHYLPNNDLIEVNKYFQRLKDGGLIQNYNCIISFEPMHKKSFTSSLLDEEEEY